MTGTIDLRDVREPDQATVWVSRAQVLAAREEVDRDLQANQPSDPVAVALAAVDLSPFVLPRERALAVLPVQLDVTSLGESRLAHELLSEPPTPG
jgi:hypothetical protein